MSVTMLLQYKTILYLLIAERNKYIFGCKQQDVTIL